MPEKQTNPNNRPSAIALRNSILESYRADIASITFELKRYRQTLYNQQSPLRRRQYIRDLTKKRRMLQARLRRLESEEN